MNSENGFLRESKNSLEKLNLIKEKLAASWGSTRDQLGVINNQRLVEVFYQSLYLPNEFAEDEIVERPGFNRAEVLRKNLNLKVLPDKEEFIREILHALIKEVDYEACLYPGAKEFVGAIMKRGLVTIWTQGDVSGVESYPGSKEQLYKLVLSGMNDLRRQWAKKTDSERGEVLSVAAAENKFTLVDKILNEYKDRQIDKIILIEDRLGNIIKFLDMLKNNANQINCVPIWVRQGNSKNSFPNDAGKTIENYKQEYNAVDEIGRLTDQLEQKALIGRNDKLGFVIDFDDVLLDDAKKMRFQAESVINKLKSKNWLE